MNRRGFLTLAGGASVYALFASRATALPTIPDRPDAEAADATSWIAHKDGRYLLSVPRAELGQNVSTGLKRIACAELGVDPAAVDVTYADTRSITPYRATVGSESVQDYALPLALACASLREAVAVGGTGRVEAAERPMEDLRAFREGALAGDMPLVGGEEIVTGGALFASDVRLPGMLYGRILRSDASPEIESAPIAWDEATARAERGFVALVRGHRLDMNDSEGLGIVAKTPGALDRIEAALNVTWEVRRDPSDADIARMIDVDRKAREGAPRYDLENDRMDEDAPWDVDLRIDTPFAAHAAIEPRVAVADVTKDGGRVWVGSQDPFFVRDALVDRLDFDENALFIIPQRVGGGFGGKAIPLAEIGAAALSRAVGAPVKVQWTRSQEHTHAYHRPTTSHRVRARIEGGKVRDWSHRFVSGHVIFSNAVLPSWMQTFTDFIGDDGAVRNAAPPYAFGAAEIGYDLERLPIRTAAWRGLGAGPNSLVIEMGMEAAARAAGIDPIEFRLGHIADPRLRAALETVRDLAGPPPGPGRGVGCGIYKGVSYGAVIADFDRRADGTPFVAKLHAAHDCGMMIDPDQVRAQCEGNLVWSLGMVMTERLTVERGAVAERDFADAPIPIIPDIPPMEIALIPSRRRPVGAGETLMASAPGAIANGYAALTGAPPTRLPVGA